ncbi:hypothetical protein MLD38_033201 [Melastoma candidum]|uniref:Uncharacterized protein n=1 Tax=Melastoma candidum TaxID=119954 RepID=A0ACB9M9P2_9MYRT|nr:hypothetical protein MLD38_033201 [Melastoma candidum]
MESSGESPSVGRSVDFPELSVSQATRRRSGVLLARTHSSKYRKASTKKIVASADQTTRLRRSRSIRLSRQSSRNVLRSVARPVIKKDSSVDRPTCSSAIKGSKSIGHCLDGRDPACDLPKKTSAAEVCPFSYCSLHGHRHAVATASPSLKRMKSSRKRIAVRGKKPGARSPLDNELNKETDSSFAGENDESGEKERKGDHPQPPQGVEIPDSRTGVAFSSMIGGRKCTVLWMLIYENMVSDIASETPIRGNVMRGMEFAESKDTGSESGTTASTPDEQMGICQGDVVMLLQGALDKLLLEQKSNRSSDTQSVGDDSNLSRASSFSEPKDEVEPGANTTRALQNDEGSSNRWSRLRKLILMKRFVKALEKNKRFNPRMRQGQKSEAGHEAEVVNLRPPLIGERKRSEEWMLDYALREVVSRLDTDQQRKVSLLIEAFEKLSPMQGGNPTSGHKASSRLQLNLEQPEGTGCLLESNDKSTIFDSSPASLEQNVELFESERKNEESVADPESCALASENDSEWSTEEPTASDSASSSDPEIGNSVEVADEAPNTDDEQEDHTENHTGGLVGPDTGPHVDVPFSTELGQGKNNGLWSLIYSHMVSNIEENSEGRLPVRGTADNTTEDDNLAGDLNVAVVSKGESESDRDTAASTPDEQLEICQSDAVKLLQEALVKLLQQQEAVRSLGSQDDAVNGTVDEKTGNGTDRNDTRSPEKPVSGNRWSRLKKLILLKRFVRAVEKAKKIDPKLRRRHQRPEAYPDAEMVSLRRQSIEERKRSEEWMLDYALRQAVSKLDQEQKRRVSLLVEAFEKMSPAQGNIPAANPNSTSVLFRGESLPSSVADEEQNTLVSKNDSESKKKEHETDLCPDPTEISRTVEEPLEARSENKRYTKLWYMVYQHMVSGLEAEQGQENTSPDGTDTSCPRQLSPDQSAEGIELEKIEAVRLVQEAIDGILISEGEEDSINDQSQASNQPEDAVEDKGGDTGSKPEARFEDRGGVAKKNWNNLKKVILIKRFVKSLEKVGKHDDPRQKPGRVCLPTEDRTRLNREEEGVKLRRRDTDEKKDAEEWMLDYAMRRVVLELTPARKRKVKLLVEAFESVAPPAEVVRDLKGKEERRL